MRPWTDGTASTLEKAASGKGKKERLLPLLLLPLSLALLLCGARTAQAATYYISSAIGSDTNVGTSKTLPWAHAPGMQGCTGICSSTTPQAGDQFILRGGDTWGSANLPWDFTWSGAAGNRIYLGVDKTWFSGSSFAKPVVNGGSACCSSALLILDHDGHVTLDGMEFTGLMMLNAAASSIDISGSTIGDILMTNLYVHNWNRCTGAHAPVAACSAAVTDNSANAGGIQGDAYTGIVETGVIIDHSEIGNPENGGNIGSCAHNIEQFNYSYCHDASSGCKQGCRIVHDSRFNNIGDTFDGVSHQDVIYADTFLPASPNMQSYIYNNLITNSCCFASATSIYPNPFTSNATTSIEYWIFNNVVWGPNANIGNDIDSYNPLGLSLTVKIHDWNNTYAPNPASCVVATTRPGGVMTQVDVQNTHCVGTTGSPLTCNNMATSCTATNYVSQPTATATGQGYATSNNYAPTSASGSTVGAGANLTSLCSGPLVPLCTSTTLGNTITGTPRPTIGAWDVGAFQFSSSGSPSSACDVNKDGSTNVADVQGEVNQALGISACANDINQDGSCNVIDVQRVVNAALGGQCVAQ